MLFILYTDGKGTFFLLMRKYFIHISHRYFSKKKQEQTSWMVIKNQRSNVRLAVVR